MDTNSLQIIVIIVIVILTCIYVYVRNKKNAAAAIERRITKEWGNIPSKKYTSDSYSNISHYFRNSTGVPAHVIDDITWNDLGMDDIFRLINNTYSSTGQEYLYKLLRTPCAEEEVLKEFGTLADIFGTDEALRKNMQRAYMKLGTSRNISVSDYLEVITGLEPESNAKHYAGWAAIAASFALLAFSPAAGIVAICIVIGYIVVSYYKCKAQIDPYLACVNHILKLDECSSDVISIISSHDGLEDYVTQLSQLHHTMAADLKGSGILGASSGLDGSVAAMLLDYVRILTHLDIIRFNKMIKKIALHKEQVFLMMELLGRLESAIAVASFRQYLDSNNGWCEPGLSHSSIRLNAEGLYHPLINNPVANSIDEEHCVLITGSNASGKSTFLKTIAINAILAQTIYTCTAASYSAGYYRIYSSMALRDDISRSESYYMAEIRSLKRIMDAARQQDSCPVLCFIDEVLRGTNTVERIAASAQILKDMAERRVLCFAATHDIELTELLESCYSNYHFQEEVLDNDVKFNYRLYTGRAASRNAIKLLSIMGYDDAIIASAEQMASDFIKTGKWRNI